jgi:hypothetical protein
MLLVRGHHDHALNLDRSDAETRRGLVGARFVSFNFLNPLIWVEESS